MIDRLVAAGRLPSVDPGPTRRTLIPAGAIEDLVARPYTDEVPRGRGLTVFRACVSRAGQDVDQASSGLAT